MEKEVNIPKPPEYWKWRRAKRTTWEAAIKHPHDSFLASDLNTDSSLKTGHAMRDLCEDGYFSRNKMGSAYSTTYIYSAEHPFMAYKERYLRER